MPLAMGTDLSNCLRSGQQMVSWSSLHWPVVMGRELLIAIADLKCKGKLALYPTSTCNFTVLKDMVTYVQLHSASPECSSTSYN